MKIPPFSLVCRKRLMVGVMALFSFLGQIGAQILDWHVNPSNPTLNPIDWNASATPGSPTQAAPYYGWFNVQTNSFGTYSGLGGGVGTIANLSRDITGTTTLAINTPTTVGMLLLGDMNATNSYTLGGTSTLTFNTGNGSHGLLNKVIGATDNISVSTIGIVGALDINSTTGNLNFTSAFSGTGGLNIFGNRTVTMRGNSTLYTGTTTLFGSNSGDVNNSTRVILNATSGNALGGTIVLGQGTRNYAGFVTLQLDQARTHFDQISNTAMVRFDGQGGRNAYFKMMGGSEEVGSIWAPEGTSVIENAEGEAVNTNATLTVGSNNSDSYFNGHIRSRAGGAGTGLLGITKNGTGTLTLVGGEIRYGGPTLINGGRVILQDTSRFDSSVSNFGVLEIRTNSDVNMMFDYSDNGGVGSIVKSGSAALNLGQGSRTGNLRPGTNPNEVVSMSDTTSIEVGMRVTGSGIPAGTTVIAKTANSITLSNPLTATSNADGVGLTFYRSEAYTFNSAFRSTNGTLNINVQTAFNGGLFLTGGAHLNFNAAVTNQSFGSAGSTLASLSQTEGGAANFNASVTVNGATVFDDFGGDSNPEDVNVNVATTFNGTFTAKRRETLINANTTFGSDVILEGSIGGSNFNTFTVRNSGTMALSPLSASIRLNGSTFIIDNTGGNLGNRVDDKFDFVSNGGTLRFFHANNDVNYSETLGAVSLSSGMLTVETSRSLNVGFTSTLTLESLTRTAGSYATVQFLSNAGTGGTFVGGSLSSARNRVLITNKVADEAFMGAWVTALAQAGTTTVLEWAKYDYDVTPGVGTGVTPFVDADYAINSAETGWTAGQHIKLRANGSNLTTSLTANRTVNSLNFQLQSNNSATLTLGTGATGFTLKVGSGGIISSGLNNSVINTVNNTTAIGRLTGGLQADGTYQLITTVHDPSRVLTITAVIENDGANAMALVKSGTGRLDLGASGTATTLWQNNTYSGGTFINGGSILLRRPTAQAGFEVDGLLGATGTAVTFNGGTLRIVEGSFNISSNIALARNFRIGESGGVIDVDGSRVFNIVGAITGINGAATEGVFSKLSANGLTGILNVTSSGNNLAGGFFHGGGTTNFTGGGNIFGFIEQNAGTLNITGVGNQIGRLRFDGGQMTISGTTITNVAPAEGFISVNGGSGETLTFLNGNVIDRELRILAATVVFGDGSNLSATNTYNPSSIIITNGALEIVSPDGIAGRTIGSLTLGNGFFRLNNNSGSTYTFTLKGVSGGSFASVSSVGSNNVNLAIESDLNLTYDGTLAETGGGQLGLIKNGLGMLTLTNPESNYTGPTIVNGGVLNATFLALPGNASAVGAASNVASNFVFMEGTGFRYSGTTLGRFNRSFTVEAGTDGVSFIAAGTGSTTAAALAARLIIDQSGVNNIVYTGSGHPHIILTGSNAGNNEFRIGIGDKSVTEITSVTKTGSGLWIMNRANNTYTGTTTVMQGTLAVSANGALGAAGGPAVRLAGGTLELRNVTYTTLEDIAMEGGVLAALTGTSRWAGGIYLGVNSVINVATGASLAIGNLTGRGGLTFQGEGTLIFEGSNYPTSPALPSGYGYGGIAVQAGTLVLRYTNATENKLPASGLTLGGGRLGATLRIENDSGGLFTALFEDDVSGTTLSTGAHRITRDANASNIWLKLNGLNRLVGSTLELGGDNIITIDTLNINGILGGWATVVMPDGSISWAFNSGVVASTSIDRRNDPSVLNGFGVADSYVRGLATANYAVDVWGQETAGPFAGFLRNTDVVTSGFVHPANQNTNTLRFNQNDSTILNLSGTNTIMTGGILVTPLVGGSGPAKYPKIQGGTLTAGANALGADLLVNQAAVNGVFEIASVIANNPAVGTSLSGNTTTSGTRIVSIAPGNIGQLYPGMQVSGAGITEGTYILSVNASNNTITLSANATGSATVTLQFNQKNGTIASGTNTTLNLSAGYNTTNLYVGMIVTGPGILPGTVITAINSSTQIIINNGVVGGSSGAYNFNPSNGLVKNGDGTLLLTGLNTYTGATVINEGALAILTISNGGVASSLGAASAAAGNLVFNGGSLLFAGEGGSSNRGYTNNNEAIFDVMREAAVLSFTGTPATAGSIAEYLLRKTGSGTLTLTLGNTAPGGFGTTQISAEDGVLQLRITILNNSPVLDDRFARGDVSALFVSGGTFELHGSRAGTHNTFNQNMPKVLTIGAGASTIKVTSEGTTMITNLNLMDGTSDVARYSGGTVLFQENPTLNGLPTVNGGVANIRLTLPAIFSNIILPWAVYQDTSNFSQLGVNEFATSTPNLSAGGIGEIVSASSISLHDIGSNTGSGGTANVANWNGSILNPSESDVIGQNFAGITPSDGRVQTLRFFSATADTTVNVSNTFVIERGAILLANHIGNREKMITGGTLTSAYGSLTAGVVDLIIHNYNPANDFVIGSTIINPVGSVLAFVQSGTGTTTLTGSNTYTGNTYVTGGVLRVDNAASLPTNSNLVLDGGVLGLNHATAFTRTLGTGVGQVQFTGNGGFAAYGANRTVSLNSGGALTWGLGGFVPGSNMLLFGSHDATHTVLFTNAIDLGRFFRVVKVANGGAALEAEMTGNLSGPGGGLIKTGTGALKLSGTNTYSGLTVVANGMLVVNSGANLGTTGVELSTTVESTTDTMATLQFAGTVANPDAMGLPITVGNRNTDSINVIQTQEDFNLTGAVTVNRTAAMGRTYLAPNAGSAATYSNISGTGGITVIDSGSGAGEGTVILAGSNNYGTDAGYGGPGAAISGGTVVREGRVLLRNSNALGGTTVELGDTRIGKTDVQWATDQRSVTAMGGFFDADSDGIGLSGGPGGFLGVSPTLLGGAVALNDRVLVKDEHGNPELNGIYVVAFINADGSVNLVRASDFDQAGEMQYGSTVTVNNGSSSQNGTTWFMAAPNVTAPNQADTDPTVWLATAINSNVGLQADAAGIIVSNAIDINATNGAGTTTVGGSSTLTSGSAEFTGAVTLQNVANGTAETKTLNATSSTTDGEGIKFSGIIGEALGTEDTLSLDKTGAGRVTLSGANTYRGTTTVSQGYLRAANNTALGGSGSAGTTVANGATLELAGNITVPATESLTISGNGVGGNTGALRNVSGDNTYNGTVTLAADSRINSDSGTLTLAALPNSVSGTNTNLTVGGAGAVTMAGAVSLGNGSVTKDGGGVLTYSASNSYTGGTTVSGGTLVVNNPTGGSGTGTGNITVASGATLAGNGFIAPTAVAGTSISIASGANLAVGLNGSGPVETLNITLAGSTLDLDGSLRLDLYANEGGNTLTEMDRLVFSGTGTVDLTGSSLFVNNINSLSAASFTAGSSWDLIDWGGLTVVGTFSNLTNGTNSLPNLPTLTGSNIWDLSQLYTTGVISITVVPEPGRVLLLVAGVCVVLMRRRRKVIP